MTQRPSTALFAAHHSASRPRSFVSLKGALLNAKQLAVHLLIATAAIALVHSANAADAPLDRESAIREVGKVTVSDLRFALEKDGFGSLKPRIRGVVSNGSNLEYSSLRWQAELFLDGASAPVARSQLFDWYERDGGLRAGVKQDRAFHVEFGSESKWTTLEIQNAKQRSVKLTLLPEGARDFGDRQIVPDAAPTRSTPFGQAPAPAAAAKSDSLVDSVLSMLPLLLITAVVGLVFFQRRKLSQNFASYRQKYPQHVSAQARVSCYSCGGGNIGTERLMNNNYMRRHFCRTCGTTLYYSPEG